MASKYIYLASFDIGKRHFGQYVEKCRVRTLKDLQMVYKSLPKTKQRRVKGPMNSDVEHILERIYLGGLRIQTGVYDLREEGTSDLTIQVRKNLITHLNKYKKLWDKCDMFIIEQQYFAQFSQRGRKGKKTEANVDAIKLAECVLSWFLDNYPTKETTLFNSTFKTQVIGAPPMKDKERKKWAVDKVQEIYQLRGDKDAIELFNLPAKVKNKRMNNEEKIQGYIKDFRVTSPDIKKVGERVIREKQKLSDISDACIQLQAFKYRKFIGNF